MSGPGGALLVVLLALAGCSDSGPGVICGGKTCGAGQRCCGTVTCGMCVPEGSETACKPAPCYEASTALDGRADAVGGIKCGTAVCGKGSICCGPPACGYCIPENSGAYCPSQCPDAKSER